jgi:serine/threonine-protein kinase
MSAPAFKRLGKYEIVAELGRGGFGTVFRAFDPTVGRMVAIKVLMSEAGKDLLARFRNEAAAAGNLRHENIVTIYEFGDDKGVSFIVMEHLEGEDLQQALASGKPLTLLEKISIMTQSAAGLDCAHRHGVVHRDVKPANIRLLPDGRVKIMDFGIARLVRDAGAARLTRQGHLLGTLLYMAPEQLMGSESDALSDIFAYGVTFYELLTGRHPFQADDPRSVFYKITSEDPEPIHHLVPDCPETLDHVIRRALHKERELRYQTLRDLKVDVEPVLIALRKERAAALVASAHLLAGDRSFEQALGLLNEAIDLDSANDSARDLRETVQAELRRRLVRPKIDVLLAKADRALGEDNCNDAVQALEAAVQLDPQDPSLQARSFEARLRRDQQRESRRLLAEARTELGQGNLTAALEKTSEVISLNPNSAEGRMLLESVQAEIDKRERQKRLQEKLQSARDLLSRDSLDEALAVVNSLDLDERDTPEAMNLRAAVEAEIQKRERQRRLQEKLQSARELLSLDSLDEASAVLNSVDPEEQDAPDAVDLRAAVAVRKAEIERRERLTAELTKASALLDCGQFVEAAGLLERLRAEFPDEPRVKSLLVEAQRQQAAFERAQAFEKLEAEVLRLAEAEQFEKAAALVDSAMKEYPGDAGVLRLRDTLLETKAEWERRQAEIAAEQAAARQRREEQEREARSRVRDAVRQCAALIDAGEMAKAERLLQNALRDFPDDPELAALQQTIKAESDRRRRIEATRRAAENARALLDRGQRARAIELLQAAAVQYPGDPVILDALAQARGERAGRSDTVEPVARETRLYVDERSVRRTRIAAPVAQAVTDDPSLSMPAPEASTTGDVGHEISARRPGVARPRRLRTAAISAIACGCVLVAMLAATRMLRSGAAVTALVVETEPAGAAVRIDDWPCATSDCRMEVSAGNHRVDARLPGYAPALQAASVGKGEAARVRIALVPLPTSLVVTSNFAAGTVDVDGRAAGRLTDGQLRLDLQPGSHHLRIAGSDGEVSLRVKTAAGQLPEWNGPIAARGADAVVVTSMGGSVRAGCSRCDGKPLVDGQRLDGRAMEEGAHELTARAASGEIERAFFRTANAPAIAIHLSSAASSNGMLLVETNVDGATVTIDRHGSRRVNGGRLLIPLEPRDYRIQIRKPGYRVTPDHIITKIRKGDQVRAEFRLDPVPGVTKSSALEPPAKAAPALPDAAPLPAESLPPAPKLAITPGVEAPRMPPPPEQANAESARIQRESAAAAAVAAKKAEDQIASDRNEISRLLTTYATAFEKKDLPLLKSVWPSLPESKLSEAFRGRGEIRSQLRALAPAELTGDRASIRCLRVTEQATQFGRQKPVEDPRTVHLRKESGRWIISAID